MFRRAWLRNAQRHRRSAEKAITRNLVKLGSTSWKKALELLAESNSLVHRNAVISACSKARQWSS
eukprot:symbB.v1.2.003529.t1/scaffold196.1/size274459/1